MPTAKISKATQPMPAGTLVYLDLVQARLSEPVQVGDLEAEVETTAEIKATKVYQLRTIGDFLG